MTVTPSDLSPPLVHSGKVRDLYDAGEGLLLMVASDRISAFDVVFAEPVPDKGRVLTAMSAFWYAELADLAPGSFVTADPNEIAAAVSLSPSDPLCGRGRSMLVRRAEMLPLECIVRGYLAGQAAHEYEASGTVHGTKMPTGLRLADRFEAPLFTPSTKATTGHDENIDFARAASLVGAETAEVARATVPRPLQPRRGPLCRGAGFVLADTKFELGFVDGVLDALRRGGDPGLLAAVAGRPGGAGHHPAGLRQATAARLGERPALGQAAARRPRCRRRSWPPRPSATRRPTSGSPAGAWPTGTVPPDEVRRRISRSGCGPRIADPEGATIERALPALGFDDVHPCGPAGRSASRSRPRRGRRRGPGERARRPSAGQPGHGGHRPLEPRGRATGRVP